MNFELYEYMPTPCSYKPHRESRVIGRVWHDLSTAAGLSLLQMGFRHSGNFWYRPHCDGCISCLSIRIPVHSFTSTKSQRRALRKNADLRYALEPLHLTATKRDMYMRYLAKQHGDTHQTEETLEEFLYHPYAFSREICYYLGDTLVAVSSVDFFENEALSSIYHYFDPDYASRSIGVYSVLAEIDLCKQLNIPYYYLGFWIPGCKAMDYKRNYQPFEWLWNGRWRAFSDEFFSMVQPYLES